MNRYIAFLDILGYKDIIENNSTNYISELLSKSIDLSYEMSIDIWNKLPLEYKEAKDDIQYTIISDSIIIWSKNDSLIDLFLFLITSRSIFFSFLINGMPLRGGITIGEIEVLNKKIGKDNFSNIFFGVGLTNAYKIENSQNWSGCIVDKKCFKILDDLENADNIKLKDFMDLNLITSYNVPMKNDTKVESFVLNWPYITGNEIDIHLIDGKWLFSIFSAHNKNIIKDEGRNKLFNTVEFFLEIKNAAHNVGLPKWGQKCKFELFSSINLLCVIIPHGKPQTVMPYPKYNQYKRKREKKAIAIIV